MDFAHVSWIYVIFYLDLCYIYNLAHILLKVYKNVVQHSQKTNEPEIETYKIFKNVQKNKYIFLQYFVAPLQYVNVNHFKGI